MPKIIIVYDPTGIMVPVDMKWVPEHRRPRHAVLDLADDMKGRDIYEIARKLAEMLLEQLP